MKRAIASFFETGDETASVRCVEDGRARASRAILGRLASDLVGAASPLRDAIADFDLVAFAGKEVQVEIFGDGALPLTLRSVAVEFENET